MWGSGEISFQVDSWVWPHTNALGGFLGPNGAIASHVYMAPFSTSANNGSTDHRTLIHELGHLAMALQDEYMGANLNGNYCTEHRHSDPAGGPLAANGNQAACIMDSQFESSKYCSAHNDSAHRFGTWQPKPCWHTINDYYKDPGPGGGSVNTGVAWQDRWILKTPEARGAGRDVGRLACWAAPKSDLNQPQIPRPVPAVYLRRSRGDGGRWRHGMGAAKLLGGRLYRRPFRYYGQPASAWRSSRGFHLV